MKRIAKAWGCPAGLCLFILIASCATTPEMPMSERVYRTVLDTGQDKNAAYRIANEWMVDMFTSAEAVVEYQDKEEGIIKGKARFTNVITGDFRIVNISFTLTVEVKDDRVRVSFDNMKALPSDPTNFFSVAEAIYNQGAHDAFVELAKGMVTSLEADMAKGGDDW